MVLFGTRMSSSAAAAAASIVNTIRQRGIRILTDEMIAQNDDIWSRCSIEYMQGYTFAVDKDYEFRFSLHGPTSARNLKSFLCNDILYETVTKYVDVKSYFRKFDANDIKEALKRILIAETETLAAAAAAAAASAQSQVAAKAMVAAAYKKKSISHVLKRRVWAAHIGEEVGKTKCLCCKLTDITQLTFHCGHIVAEKNGGSTTVENMLPICQSCNSSMGTQNLYSYMAANGL